MFHTKSSEVMATMTGRSCGSVMFQNRRQRPAPSTSPASYSSLGMPCRPASRTTVVCGMPVQTPTTMIAGSASEKSASQLISVPSRLFRMPASGW